MKIFRFSEKTNINYEKCKIGHARNIRKIVKHEVHVNKRIITFTGH